MRSKVEHCWLIDFDRTISSVEIVMNAVEHVCEKLDLDYDKVKQQQGIAETHGRSFSVLTVVMSLWPEKYDEFCCELKSVNHLDSVYPDALIFIDALKASKQEFVIITYGDPEWQLLKIHFAKLDVIPHIICDIAEKTLLIEQFRNGSIFEVQTSRGVIATETITLVDDKPAAFTNSCKGVSGILIERRGQPVTLPAGVRLIHSFKELEGLL